MIMSIKNSIIDNLIKFYLNRKYKFKVNFNDFDPNRKDSYILLANSSSLLNGLYISAFLKNKPIVVLNELQKTNKYINYFLSKYEYHVLKRSVGLDTSLIRKIDNCLSEKPVLIFPEKNTSFFGEGSQIPQSIAKLIKKDKKEVVVCKINGAYLSNPRWGLKNSKRSLIELNFETLIKESEIANLEIKEIYEKVDNFLQYNDFDWNRSNNHFYNPKNRALGLESYLYMCPKCMKSQTLSTKKNDIYCSECGHIASFDDFSLINGLDFDDLVSWDSLQKRELPRLFKEVVYSEGSMFMVNEKTMELTSLGHADLEIIKNQLFVLNKMKEYMFEIEKIEGLKFVRRNEIFFKYGKKLYLFKLEDPMIVYDRIHYVLNNKKL